MISRSMKINFLKHSVYRLMAICIFMIYIGISIGGVFAVWKGEFFNYDLYHDLTNAANLLRDFNLPRHGSVSSFGVFNPPGIGYSLVLGLAIFPKEPVLAVHVVSVIISLFTLIGLGIIAKRHLGFMGMIWVLFIYISSSTGAYFLAELRPRAHPLFLVWTIYFIEKWILERKTWAISFVVMTLSAGLYWMLEIAPLLIGVLILYILFRPPVAIKPLSIALIMSLLVWFPYLSFQVERGFHDIYYLLIKLEPAVDMGAAFHSLLKENGLEVSMYERVHEIPMPPEINDNPVILSPLTEAMLKSRTKIGSIFPQHIHSSWFYYVAGIQMAAFVAVIFIWMRRKYFSIGTISIQFKAYSIWVILLATCVFILYIFTRGQPANVVENRFLWIWPLFVVVIVGLHVLFMTGWRYHVSMISLFLILFGVFPNSTGSNKIKVFVENDFGIAPKSEFNQVIDFAASIIDKYDLPPRIGYDYGIFGWLPAAYSIDQTSSVGTLSDLVFKYRHDIQNLNTAPFQISRNDIIRIVEHRSQTPWRQTYYNLTGYPEMLLVYQNSKYSVLLSYEYSELASHIRKGVL